MSYFDYSSCVKDEINKMISLECCALPIDAPILILDGPELHTSQAINHRRSDLNIYCAQISTKDAEAMFWKNAKVQAYDSMFYGDVFDIIKTNKWFHALILDLMISDLNTNEFNALSSSLKNVSILTVTLSGRSRGGLSYADRMGKIDTVAKANNLSLSWGFQYYRTHGTAMLTLCWTRIKPTVICIYTGDGTTLYNILDVSEITSIDKQKLKQTATYKKNIIKVELSIKKTITGRDKASKYKT